jgi:4-amino-4-deoxy-L-arabinose transferase-like glycosyltransferase
VILADLAGVIVLALVLFALVVGVYSFVHAAMQRPDAYTAAGKLTKPVWLAILGVSVLLLLLFRDPFGAAIAAVAAGIYLVDVRPKLLDIQGKSR